LNEVPVFEKDGLVNGSRLRKLGELTVEILHRQAVAYHLSFDSAVDVREPWHTFPASSETDL
jgi:hypothetical protein